MASPSSSSSPSSPSPAQRASGKSNQKRSKRDLVLGGGSSFRVWYCCHCGDGPLNTTLISYCPSCDYQRCADCVTRTHSKRD